MQARLFQPCKAKTRWVAPAGFVETCVKFELERETGAEAEHARREHLGDAVARSGRRANAGRLRSGANGGQVALQDRVRVQHVEPVERQREADVGTSKVIL